MKTVLLLFLLVAIAAVSAAPHNENAREKRFFKKTVKGWWNTVVDTTKNWFNKLKNGVVDFSQQLKDNFQNGNFFNWSLGKLQRLAGIIGSSLKNLIGGKGKIPGKENKEIRELYNEITNSAGNKQKLTENLKRIGEIFYKQASDAYNAVVATDGKFFQDILDTVVVDLGQDLIDGCLEKTKKAIKDKHSDRFHLFSQGDFTTFCRLFIYMRDVVETELE